MMSYRIPLSKSCRIMLSQMGSLVYSQALSMCSDAQMNFIGSGVKTRWCQRRLGETGLSWVGGCTIEFDQLRSIRHKQYFNHAGDKYSWGDVSVRILKQL